MNLELLYQKVESVADIADSFLKVLNEDDTQESTKSIEDMMSSLERSFNQLINAFYGRI